MRLFNRHSFDSLDDLLQDQLRDLYDAEVRLTTSLPEMVEAAQSSELRAALQRHLRETEGHVTRLEQVFRRLGHNPDRGTCEAMKGLIDEGRSIVKASGDRAVKDAAIIAAAQRIEHYEMAGYGCARAFAQELGHHEIANILQQMLEEEEQSDELLTQIAEQRVNVEAAGHVS
jgi:ferritin-like metal-binding protein YciE